MLNEFITHDRIAEALREAEKERLINMAMKPREDRTKRILDVFLCRVGLNPAC